MPGFLVPTIKKPGDLFSIDLFNMGQFKMKKQFPARLQETTSIKTRFPSKIPVVVERYKKEKELPALDKTKFLVPEDISMSQFHSIIRNRMSVKPSQAFFLMVNRKSLMSLSLSMAEIYEQECEKDGFLYMIYCSQEGFGGFEDPVEEEAEEVDEDGVEIKDTEAARDETKETERVVQTSTRQLSKPSTTERDAAADSTQSDVS